MQVQNKADFEHEFAELAVWQDREDVAALVRYRPQFVQALLAAATDFRAGQYPATFTSTTPIDPRDIPLIRPSSQRSTRSKVAAFYSGQKHVLFVLEGEGSHDVIAHELCHAYTHPSWTEMQVQVSAFGHTVEMNQIDEGVTSEMANIVLLRFLMSQSGGVPVGRPNGYVGYSSDVENRAARFCSAVDGQPSPGERTKQAYFGGKVAVRIDAKNVDKSDLSFGAKAKKVKLADLVS